MTPHLKKMGKVPVDTSRIYRRSPKNSQMQAYLQDKRFSYKEEITPKGYLERFSIWLSKKIAKMIRIGNENYVWDGLIILIILFTVFFVVTRLLKSNFSGLFYGTGKKSNIVIDDELSFTDIAHINYDQLISEYLSKGDFRVVIRLQYLKVLKLLSDKEFIIWKIDKTNSDYFNEIDSKKLKSPFFQIIQIFNYIWYGSTQLEKEEYQQYQKSFEEFLLLIQKA